MAFRIDPSSIAFLETRRGINATATIVSDKGVKIGRVDDIAERIVADVRLYLQQPGLPSLSRRGA